MAKKFKYKNKTDLKQAIIGVGEVAPRGTIQSDKIINNPNFSMIGIDSVTKPKNNKKK